MENKVMVEVGDLEKLKKAIQAFDPWISRGTTEHTQILVALAKRVVAEEERIQTLLNTKADIDSSIM